MVLVWAYRCSPANSCFSVLVDTYCHLVSKRWPRKLKAACPNSEEMAVLGAFLGIVLRLTIILLFLPWVEHSQNPLKDCWVFLEQYTLAEWTQGSVFQHPSCWIASTISSKVAWSHFIKIIRCSNIQLFNFNGYYAATVIMLTTTTTLNYIYRMLTLMTLHCSTSTLSW